jgi:hypothetical protein
MLFIISSNSSISTTIISSNASISSIYLLMMKKPRETQRKTVRSYAESPEAMFSYDVIISKYEI